MRIFGTGFTAILLMWGAPLAQGQSIDPMAAFRCEQAHAGANYGDAVRTCRPLAEQGLADAQLILGELHQRGLGVAQDNQEAVRWFRAAAEQGLPQAQLNLGMAYRYGAGVGQDLREAYAWLTLAAEGGLDDARAARELTARRMSESEVAAARSLVAERRGSATAEPVAEGTVSPSPRELVAAVQTRLAGLGYEPGPADGVMGGKSRTAISSFQRTSGLTVDGRPSEALLAELDEALASAGVAESASGLAGAAPAPAAVAEAVTGEQAGQSIEAQRLAEELRVRISRAEAERSASRDLLDDLRAIVRRYEWPWTDRRLDDDFADGDHTSNPAWTIVSGRFDTLAAMGLETRHSGTQTPAASRPSDAGDLRAQLFGVIVQEVLGSQAGTSAAANPEIFARVGFANAFAVTVRLAARPNENSHNRVVLGAFQTADRRTGYGLAYSPGAVERIELLRIAGGQETIIATGAPPTTRLDDGGIHELQWRRNKDGEMSVWIDGIEAGRVTDGVLGERFFGLDIVNEGGNYTFRRIVVHAVPG